MELPLLWIYANTQMERLQEGLAEAGCVLRKMIKNYKKSQG
jgi:hypothetical protein